MIKSSEFNIQWLGSKILFSSQMMSSHLNFALIKSFKVHNTYVLIENKTHYNFYYHKKFLFKHDFIIFLSQIQSRYSRILFWYLFFQHNIG